MANESFPSHDLKHRVSQTLFNHIDGMAIGSTVCSLHEHDIFNLLNRSKNPVKLADLRLSSGFREGFLHVALRLLAHQGFVRLSIDSKSNEFEASLTEMGRQWLSFVKYYQQIPKISRMASCLSDELLQNSSVSRIDFFMAESPLEHDGSPITRRVHDHLYGELAAVIMTCLYLKFEDQKLQGDQKKFFLHEEISRNHHISNFVSGVLQAIGWVTTDENGMSWTSAGLLAVEWSPQYFYPVSYISTFRRVPELLLGKDCRVPACTPEKLESHVDRQLDIKFSGIVYERTCRNRLLEIVLPLFNKEPLESQASGIVDTGSGDGTLLVDLFRSIKQNTLRGRFLDSFPLWIVGAEYTGIARKSTQAALQKAGIPNGRVIYGDIGDPRGLARALHGIGIDPFNSLHLSKSVIHNRAYRACSNAELLRDWTPISGAPFVSPDGALISQREIECNLAQLFQDWKPLAQKHGMIVIEAHTVDPEIVSRTVGRNIMTCMDATHGYSGQYLMEYDAFTRTVKAAGYESVSSGVLSGTIVGQPTLTINHFIPFRK